MLIRRLPIAPSALRGTDFFAQAQAPIDSATASTRGEASSLRYAFWCFIPGASTLTFSPGIRSTGRWVF